MEKWPSCKASSCWLLVTAHRYEVVSYKAPMHCGRFLIHYASLPEF
jgi:hypothetical protein